MLQLSFTILAHVFLKIPRRFCVNLIYLAGAIWPFFSPCTVINPILLTYLVIYLAHVKIVHLSDAQLREHVDSGYGGRLHIGETNATILIPDGWHVYS